MAGLLGWLATGTVLLAGPFVAVETNRLSPARADLGGNGETNIVPVPLAVRPGERWFKSFSGDRVDAVLRTGPAARARVWLDGLPVARHPEVRTHGRPDSPLLRRVLAVNPLVPERWTLTLTDVPPGQSGVGFRAEGSVTGFDGAGRSDREFISTSGRVKLRPEFWADPAGAQAGQVIAWTVSESFVEEVSSGAAGEVVTLVAGLRPAEHYLGLEPLEGTNLPVAELRVSQRDGESPWEPLPLRFTPWRHEFFAAEFTAYSAADQSSPVMVYQALPTAFQGVALPEWDFQPPAQAYGNAFIIPDTDRVFRSLRIPYFSTYTGTNGWWWLDLYKLDGAGGSPGTSLESRGGALKQGYGVIEMSVGFDWIYTMPLHMAFVVRLPTAGTNGMAGLLASDGPTVSDGVQPSVTRWVRVSGVWVEHQWWPDWCWPNPCPSWSLSWFWRNGQPVLHTQVKGGMRPFRFETMDLNRPDVWLPSADFVTDVSGAFEWVPPATPAARLIRVTPTR